MQSENPWRVLPEGNEVGAAVRPTRAGFRVSSPLEPVFLFDTNLSGLGE